MTLLKENICNDNDDVSSLIHSLHPYPAKFPPQIPKAILSKYATKGQTVLDPFCGSGTTLVEAKLQGINAIGVDINGLSVLLSKVKSTPLTEDQQLQISDFINSISTITCLLRSEDKLPTRIKDIEGLNHWFQPNVAKEITLLLEEISNLDDEEIKDFLRIVLSSIIVRVSNQESDTRFAAIEKNIQDYFTVNLFIARTKEYLKHICKFSNLAIAESKLKVYNADSRNLSFIDGESIDLIITSPPYANTYDYYLYHKFRKRWLDLDVKFAQYNEIGSRREFSSLKKSPQKWNDDLKKCFLEMSRVLKKGCFAFIVIGDSVIQKELIKIDEIISEFSESAGLTVQDIVSSDLASHSKIFNPTFAQKGKKEHLITLQK
jgi:site-specific DNA-methyltransferase (cytosine-N4-specific)